MTDYRELIEKLEAVPHFYTDLSQQAKRAIESLLAERAALAELVVLASKAAALPEKYAQSADPAALLREHDEHIRAETIDLCEEYAEGFTGVTSWAREAREHFGIGASDE